MAKIYEKNENSVECEIAKNCIKIVQVHAEIKEIFKRIRIDNEKWEKDRKSISDYKQEQLKSAEEHKLLMEKIDKMIADWAEIMADDIDAL